MKKIHLIITTLLLGCITILEGCTNQDKTAYKEIQNVVEQFAQGGDKRDVNQLSKVLHKDYRLVRHEGNEDKTIILDKPSLLSQFEAKKFGGDKRQVIVKSSQKANESNAVVVAEMKGSKADFESIFTLVKVDSKWTIVQELVSIKFK